MEAQPRYQDLRQFRLPPGSRGRPAWLVQLWWLVQSTLFGCSPQVCYGWRRWLLRCFGARVGAGVLVRPTARVTYPWRVTLGDYCWIGDEVVLYSLAPIAIGAHAVVSQRSYLCAGSHDHQQLAFPLTLAPVTIEDEVWLATEVFVAPGVRVGRGSVVGARSAVFKDLPPGMICLGTPARPLRPRPSVPTVAER